MSVAPEEYNVLLTEIQINYKEQREKSTQIMFESFNVNKLSFAKQCVLSLFCSGKFTGFVVELGHGITQFEPIVDGHSIQYRLMNMNYLIEKI